MKFFYKKIYLNFIRGGCIFNRTKCTLLHLRFVAGSSSTRMLGTFPLSFQIGSPSECVKANATEISSHICVEVQ